MVKKKIWDECKIVVPMGIITSVAVILVTIAFYVGFVMNVLGTVEAMTPEVRALITADNVNLAAQVVANLCYGFLMVLIFRWAKITTPLRGGIVGAVIAVLSDLYYALALYSQTKNMFTILSISIDAFTYTVVGFIVGAGLGWALGYIEKRITKKR